MSLEDRAESLALRRMLKTPEGLIKRRKGKGGKDFDYVTRHTAFRWLDKYYPGLWSFNVIERFYDDIFKHYYVRGRLIVKDPHTKFVQEFDDFGISETKVKAGGDAIEQMYYKNACSDAFKRCAVQVGAYNDVYSEDDEGFTDMVEVEWEKILPHIGKGLEKFDSNQIGNQLALLIFGTYNIDKLLKAWDVS